MIRRALIALAGLALIAGCGPVATQDAPPENQWTGQDCRIITIRGIETCAGPYTELDEDFGTWG